MNQTMTSEELRSVAPAQRSCVIMAATGPIELCTERHWPLFHDAMHASPTLPNVHTHTSSFTNKPHQSYRRAVPCRLCQPQNLETESRATRILYQNVGWSLSCASLFSSFPMLRHLATMTRQIRKGIVTFLTQFWAFSHLPKWRAWQRIQWRDINVVPTQTVCNIPHRGSQN